MAADLETRIAKALADDAVTSAALADLVQETESAITAASEVAEAERAKALDPTLSPNPKAARAAMEDAAFARDRLKTLLPRLQKKHRKVVVQQNYDQWCDQFDAIESRHVAAVEQLKSIYTEFVPKLLAALQEAAVIDAEVLRVMYHKRNYLRVDDRDGRNLQTVELAARGLQHLGLGGYSLMKDLKLPVFNEPDKLAWPPYSPFISGLSFADVEQLSQAAAKIPGPPASLNNEQWAEYQRKREYEGQLVARTYAERAKRDGLAKP